ncbi:hypothetical protein ANN_12916 [Periplaneta americana]|uniref:Uncharacterized protein n=1 Tax=Periplaneta americana TaxID=6978 RepID=A0ABQ8TKH0_PERAM|nr:hypothetical protein ANN_12916 [Periplaneta americana]
MSPESNTESYPAFAHIGLRENPGKNLNQVTCPDRESNPGHLVSRLDALTVTLQRKNNAQIDQEKKKGLAEKNCLLKDSLEGMIVLPANRLHNPSHHAFLSSLNRPIRSLLAVCRNSVPPESSSGSAFPFPKVQRIE